MGIFSDLWGWFVPIEPDDNFTLIVRKMICMVLGLASLFGGAVPYYAFRAIKSQSATPTNSTVTVSVDNVKTIVPGEDESQYFTSFIILSTTLAVFAVCSLFSAIYCHRTKTAPDWLLYMLIGVMVVVTISFDIITRFPFPVRSTSIGLAIVSIGAGLEHARAIIFVLLAYMVANEIRDAWQVNMRLPSPYEGGPIEKFGFYLTEIFALVACSLLSGMTFVEYTTLITAARRSVELAKTVASLMLLYDTESVRDELEDFSRQFGIECSLVKGNGDGADGDDLLKRDDDAKSDIARMRRANSSAKDLVEVFLEMAANLDMYRPHLPDYVMPKQVQDGEDEEDMNEEEDDDCSNNMRLTSQASKKYSRSTAADEEDDADLRRQRSGSNVFDDGGSEHSQRSVSTDHSGAGSAGGFLPSRSGRFQPMPAPGSNVTSIPAGTSLVSMNSGTFGQQSPTHGAYAGPSDTQSYGRMTDAGPGAAARRAARGKLTMNVAALSSRTGSHNENVIVARIDLGRFMDTLLEHCLGIDSYGKSAAAASTVTKKVNTIIERLLQAAAALDGTVHSIIDDSVLLTWNATRRAVGTESKCCKFLMEVRKLAGEMLVEAGALPAPSTGSTSSGAIGGSGGIGNTSSGIYDSIKPPPSARALGTMSSTSIGEPAGADGSGPIKTPPPMNVSITSVSTDENEAKSGGSGSSTPSAGCSPRRLPSLNPARLASPTNNARGAATRDERARDKEEAVYQLQRLVTGAAVSGSSWCQIGGSEKKQLFMLSRFSHSQPLQRAVELARDSGALVLCPKLYSKVRWDYSVQGFGAVTTNVRVPPARLLPGGMRRASMAGVPPPPAPSSPPNKTLQQTAHRTSSVTIFPPPFTSSNYTNNNNSGGVPVISTTSITLTAPLALRPMPVFAANELSPHDPPLHRATTSVPTRRGSNDGSMRRSSTATAAGVNLVGPTISDVEVVSSGSNSPSVNTVPLRRANTGGGNPTVTVLHALDQAAAQEQEQHQQPHEQQEQQQPPVASLTANALEQQAQTTAGLKVSFGYNIVSSSERRSPGEIDGGGGSGGSGGFGGSGGAVGVNAPSFGGNNNTNSFAIISFAQQNASFASNQMNSSAGTSYVMPVSPNSGSSIQHYYNTSPLFRRETVALYELVGKKRAEFGREYEDREWNTVLTDIDKATGSLCDAVSYIANSDFTRARICLERLGKDVPDVVKLTYGAFSTVERSFYECQHAQNAASAAGAQT